jgi:glycosyltransferase involved in cell wall biosynthesis
MKLPVYIYDPTATDTASRVRGVGRYVQILRENLADDVMFVNDLSKIPYESIFLNPFFNLLQSPFPAKRIAKRQLTVIHDLIPLQFPAHFPIGLRGTWNVWRNKRMLNSYDHIITDSIVSQKVISSLLKIPEEKISIIYPCLPNVFYEKHESVPSVILPEPFVLYVGDVTWNKNIVTMAQAVIEAKVPCVCVGSAFSKMNEAGNNPWLKELKEFAKLTKDNPLFIFPGFVSDEELVAMYRRASANILLSRAEGFGFSYLEASSQHSPSLLADTPIFHETAGNSAIFVNHANVGAIAQAIRQITTDKKSDLGDKAFVQSQHYLRSSFSGSFKKLFDSL